MTFGATNWSCDEETSIGLVNQYCDSSLRRLQTDHIDIYWLHVDDAVTPLEEAMGALDDLVDAGKVLYTGASNFLAYRLMKALAVSDRLDGTRFAAFQGQYNLIVRGLECEHFGLLAEEGVGFVSWSPLAAGMLTGKVRQNETEAETRLAKRKTVADRLVKNSRGFEVAATVRGAADQMGCSPAQLALAWQRTKPVSSVIIGVRTQDQLRDNLGALDLAIPPEMLDELEAATRPPEEYPPVGA